MTADHLTLIREIHAKHAPGSPAHCSILILIGHLLACLDEESRPAGMAAVKELVAAHQEQEELVKDMADIVTLFKDHVTEFVKVFTSILDAAQEAA